MSVLLVTYDLKKELNSSDYQKLIGYINKYPCIKLSESSYAIETDKSPSSILDDIKPFLDSDDNLLVVALTQPFDGLHDKDVMSWLLDKL